MKGKLNKMDGRERGERHEWEGWGMNRLDGGEGRKGRDENT